MPELQVFQFDVVTLNQRGEEIRSESKSAEYFIENLGNDITLEMVRIPQGSFLMGTDLQQAEYLTNKFGDYFICETPQHRVDISEFYLGKYQITQAQWQEIMGENPAHFQNGNNHPVENISWDNCQEFITRLNQRSKYLFRLPSEAEWEYACRAGTNTPFSCGEAIISKFVNFDATYIFAEEEKSDYRQQTIPIGSFSPNSFGLYDMHGNVWEWCADTWHENYEGAPLDGSAWQDENNKAHLLRGASWYDLPFNCRSAFRNRLNAANRNINYGLRVALSADQVIDK